MIAIRKAAERGHTKIDWLDSRHTFSFGDYMDRSYMGFRQLRVINEDRVQPAKGFPTHSHRDMEIISYVLEGSIEHKDSLGNGSTIHPGEVQRMSAGTGITHSEFNHSASELVHFLQMWILPGATGIKPGYEQQRFDREKSRNRWLLLAAPEGQGGAVAIHQDASLWLCNLEPGNTVQFALKNGRHAWLQVARGQVEVNGNSVGPGDGAAVSEERSLDLTAESASELLLFDLA
jgi:redox-sensitive bicupin YhaK (pirin superfamily)